MADTKIPDLTGLTTPADGDKLYIVDVSDSTDSADGTSKHITRANLLQITGAVVGNTDTQTLTNKTIDADANTISNLAHGSEVDTPASSTSVSGHVVLATTAETTTGTDVTKAVTPDGLHDMTSLSGAAWFLDEDTLSSDSAAKVSSQQAIKAYVDNRSWDTGWIPSADTLVYQAANAFTVTGVDRTAIFSKGTKIKITQTTDKYLVVVNSTFSTDTTVTVLTNTDYTIANAAITNPYYSYGASPQGYPGWFNIASTIDWDGTDPDTSTAVAKVAINGRTVEFQLSESNTSAGSTNTQVSFTGLPNAAGTAGAYNYMIVGGVSTGDWTTAPTATARAFVYGTTSVTAYVFFSSISAKSAWCSGQYPMA